MYQLAGLELQAPLFAFGPHEIYLTNAPFIWLTRRAALDSLKNGIVHVEDQINLIIIIFKSVLPTQNKRHRKLC